MKKIVGKISCFLMICMAFCLCACGKNAKSIPYTEVYFDATLEDVLSLEGDGYETYDSIYYGKTYTFEKDYLGRTGKIKYMFNDKDELCNVAWSCMLDDGEKADILYKEIYAVIQKDYGNPEDNSGVNNYGAIWKRADGNIILSAMISSEANAVQVAFLSPEVSRDSDGKLANDSGADASTPQNPVAEQEEDNEDVTLEDIKNANSFETLLKNHTSIAYSALQYANEDVDNGYLGFDDTLLKTEGDSIIYMSSAASQSVPFTVVIEKNEEGKYTQKTQFAGESIVETEYESEDAMKNDLARLWLFDGSDFANEKITEISMQDDKLVVTTQRTPNGGEYASETVVRKYFLNPDTLELQEINEEMPTDTDYGTVLTITSAIYDEEPDFTIEFAPEPEESVTDADYDNMSSPEDGEE